MSGTVLVPPRADGIPSGIERALVIAAHPDDIEAFGGGAVALLAAAGCRVTYALVTYGEGGHDDMSVPLDTAIAIRRAEQQAAALVLGVDDVRWLPDLAGSAQSDGEVFDTPELRVTLVHLVRSVRPDLVMTFDPSCYTVGNYVNHADHRGTGAAAIAATWPAAANPRFHPELLELKLAPHTVRELWLMLSPAANHVVDIGAVVASKAAALAAHVSQLPDPAAVADRVFAEARRAAESGNSELCERYLRVRINAPECIPPASILHEFDPLESS